LNKVPELAEGPSEAFRKAAAFRCGFSFFLIDFHHSFLKMSVAVI
jgi:hypothetical protein